MFQVSSFKFHDKKGFSIIEAVIYSALLAVLILVLSQLTLSAITSYRTARIKEDLIISSGRVLENFLRESRNASKVYLPTTVFDNDLGELSLATSFQPLDKTEPETYTDIYLAGGQVWIKRENELSQPLTGSNLEVTQFKLLRSVTANNLEGLRMQFSVKSKVKPSETLFLTAFVMLKGGYIQ